jgi:DNA-binding MarR family transcriptional regulator
VAEKLRATVGFQLRRLYTRFTAAAMRDDPSSSEFVVLDTLADADVDSQRELAERLGINRTIMVRLVDRLTDAGHATRTRNPANRRSYQLSITDAGRAALADLRRAVSDRDERVTAALTEPERRRLAELLGRLLPEPATVRSIEYLAAQAHYRQRRYGDALLVDVGLRTRHFGPLSALELLAPCPQQDIAAYLGITEPAAAEVVDELVQAELVSRGQDSHDRRRYALELTDLGRTRLGNVRAAVDKLEEDVLDALGSDGYQELFALLTKALPPKG